MESVASISYCLCATDVVFSILSLQFLSTFLAFPLESSIHPLDYSISPTLLEWRCRMWIDTRWFNPREWSMSIGVSNEILSSMIMLFTIAEPIIIASGDAKRYLYRSCLGGNIYRSKSQFFSFQINNLIFYFQMNNPMWKRILEKFLFKIIFYALLLIHIYIRVLNFQLTQD